MVLSDNVFMLVFICIIATVGIIELLKKVIKFKNPQWYAIFIIPIAMLMVAIYMFLQPYVTLCIMVTVGSHFSYKDVYQVWQDVFANIGKKV